eukprot:Cvel_1708.t1-p1 / transcript=Cvel_1708.t1 / gene=Cvel_1708 / organism=Chromera_velia_CCMP2878 / gene_product=hypothetical protein / transcript_product=hypothetical protein / location=Cvel_scaffold61:131189-132343(-) / protein_length=385 / sequence_SO=supercontig / SO=protein_coding / is_pseudo=false
MRWLAQAVPLLLRLRVLNLKDNFIHSRPVFADLFSAHFSFLEELKLGGSGSSSVPAIHEALADGRLLAVRKLNFYDEHNPEIDSEEVVALFNALAFVKILHVSDLDAPCRRAFAAAMDSGHLSHLEEVTLDANIEAESEGLGVLMRSIASGRVSSLRTLKCGTISWEELQEEVGEMLKALAEGLREGRMGSLEQLSLEFDLRASGAFVPPGPLSEFGAALGVGGVSLCKLWLTWTESSDEGVGALAEGLGSGALVSLEDILLHCGAEGPGCRALGEVLGTGKVPSLRTLWLENENASSFLALVAEGLNVGSPPPSGGRLALSERLGNRQSCRCSDSSGQNSGSPADLCYGRGRKFNQCGSSPRSRDSIGPWGGRIRGICGWSAGF